MLTIVDLLFLGFGVVLTVICAKRGLLLSLIRFLRLILSALAAYLWGGHFATFVGEKILNGTIRESVYQKVSQTYQNTAGNLNADVSLSMLPKYLQTDAMREKLSAVEGTEEALVNAVTDTIAEPFSAVVCGVIGYAMVVVAAVLTLSLICVLIKNARCMCPLFGRVDTALGGALGLVFACVVLLFAGSVLKFFCRTQPVYTDSTVVRFFGDGVGNLGLKFLNLDQWLGNLTSLGK